MRKKTRFGDSKLAVAYLRVSTDDQALGLDAQRAAIGAWASKEGVTVVGWHADEGVSGGTDVDGRPGLVAALADVRRSGAGVLVVARRDRLARDVFIALGVERAAGRCGARVASADGTANGDAPADQFMRNILDSVAQFERALIHMRTQAALDVKRARRERIGAVPYGWRLAEGGAVSKNGLPCSLEPEPAEQEVVALVRSLNASGKGSWAIATELTRRGVLSRSGRPFVQRQITRILAHLGTSCKIGAHTP